MRRHDARSDRLSEQDSQAEGRVDETGRGLLASERSVSMTATQLFMDMVEEKRRTVVNK